MSRTRTFDEHAVLAGAMQAFRQHGFGGASIKDLERATGLSCGSLYNAFRDKEGLFRATLDFYVDGFVAGRFATYAGPTARLEDLEELFLSVLRPPLTDGFGCLVINSLVEFGSGPSVAAGGIGRGLALVANGLRSVLARELPAVAVETAALRLEFFYQGLLVFARAGRSEPALGDPIRDEFTRLRALRSAPREK